MRQIIFCLLLCSIHHIEGSRILAVIPTASYSHQVFYHQLWREYAIRGHEIVVITTDPTNETLPNFKEINIQEAYAPSKQALKSIIDTNVIKLILTNKFASLIMEFQEFALKLPQVQALIHDKDEHFDLVIIEHFLGPALGFKYRFNCPMIGVMSLDGMDHSHAAMGNPVHSLLYPLLAFVIKEDSSIFTRMVTTLVSSYVYATPYIFTAEMDRITRGIFGDDAPPTLKLLDQTDMLFVNVNPLFNAIRPHTPSTISIAGGMHMQPAKPLPKDLQNFLDNAKKGAIYFSLGSNVKSNELTMEMRLTIMNTLGQLPYQVLWKFEDDSLVGKPSNVHLTKWAPQQDVLRHEHVKLFITQGGLQSLEEALYLHVPIVIMPFFGDQESNAAKAESKGLGIVVDRHNFNVEDFKRAILEVIENPVYRDTAKRFATQIQDAPMPPIERVIWWTEYVLRHKGAQHLKGPILPFYQYYYLDVLFVLGSFGLILLGVTFTITRFCIRKMCGVPCCKSLVKDQKIKKM